MTEGDPQEFQTAEGPRDTEAGHQNQIHPQLVRESSFLTTYVLTCIGKNGCNEEFLTLFVIFRGPHTSFFWRRDNGQYQAQTRPSERLLPSPQQPQPAGSRQGRAWGRAPLAQLRSGRQPGPAHGPPQGTPGAAHGPPHVTRQRRNVTPTLWPRLLGPKGPAFQHIRHHRRCFQR